MSSVFRLEWYRDWFERRGRDAFVAEFKTPVLVSRATLETEVEAEAGFHTAYMGRTRLIAEMAAARAAPHDERLQMQSGEVRFIRKAEGAAFAEHVGVGRARNADVCLPHPNISKYHAYFSGTPESGYALTDADSRNGTWIGTERLTPRTAAPLVDGCTLVFGPYRFTFLTSAGFCETVARRARS